MGLKKKDLDLEIPPFSYLGTWHANLIYIDRRKCILFANDRTLFNFIASDVSRAQIRTLDNLFRDYLRCVLANESLSKESNDKLFSEYAEIGYARTDNRSVLGSMNNLAFHYKYLISLEGGVHSYMVPSIIKQLNRMPMSGIKYTYPIEALEALYETAT